MNNLVVITQKTDKANITDFGAPDKFLQQVQYLLGEQVFAGESAGYQSLARKSRPEQSALNAKHTPGLVELCPKRFPCLPEMMFTMITVVLSLVCDVGPLAIGSKIWRRHCPERSHVMGCLDIQTSVVIFQQKTDRDRSQ